MKMSTCFRRGALKDIRVYLRERHACCQAACFQYQRYKVEGWSWGACLVHFQIGSSEIPWDLRMQMVLLDPGLESLAIKVIG